MMKIARILCPTDFSETSAHAVAEAVVVAGFYHARITALHVISQIEPSFEDLSVAGLRRDTAAFFEAATRSGIPVDVLVDVGQAARHILDRAATLPADMIVMGTHGASGFEHLVLGSVTEKVVRKARCPVLTVPPRAEGRAALPFTRLLCAVDFSDASLSAVEVALSLARESGARLTLLHVLEWPWHEPPPPAMDELPAAQAAALVEFRRYSEESARKRLESLVPDSDPVSRVTTRLQSGKPHEQILEVASAEHSDLIVIGVQGRNALDVALFGSTTNQVVRRATCPVLTLR
jgi:nucleotide-binding universal stress UspA family protein